MNIPASTEIRHRGYKDFLVSYQQFCALQNSVPIKAIKAGFDNNALSLDVSKVRVSDWPPFLRALSNGRLLHTIHFYSSWKGSRPTPVIHQPNGSLPTQLLIAIKQLFNKKNHLKKLIINDVILQPKAVSELAIALSSPSVQLEYLSLSGTSLGDIGVAKFSCYLRSIDQLKVLDLSKCNLTPSSISMITDLISSQKNNRNNKLWIETLRKDDANSAIQSAGGLRDIRLNNNENIGNSVRELISSIEDDLWISRIELRQCNITPDPALHNLINILIENVPQSLAVFDLRSNPIMTNSESKELIQKLMAKMISNHPHAAQYSSLDGLVDHVEHSSNNGKKFSKNSNRPKTAPDDNRRSHVMPNSNGCHVFRNPHEDGDEEAGNISTQNLLNSLENLPEVKRRGEKGFVPWRTAGRSAERNIVKVSNQFGVDLESKSRPTTSQVPLCDGHSNVPTPSSGCRKASQDDDDVMTEYADLPCDLNSKTKVEYHNSNFEIHRSNKEMDEIRRLTARLKSEREHRMNEEGRRKDAETKYQQLSLRISSLESLIESKDEQISTLLNQKDGFVLVEEGLLKNVELSFSRFQGFLNTLNDIGLGKLAEMANLNIDENKIGEYENKINNFNINN